MDCTDTEEKYKIESVTAAMERNDCVVRAIASSFEIPYNEAHEYIADVFKRRPKQGTRGTVLRMRGLSEAFGKKIVELGKVIPEYGFEKKLMREYYSKTRGKFYGAYTTKSFIAEHPKGTYFILCSGHAFTIKDGKIFGNPKDATQLRTRIKQAFKIG